MRFLILALFLVLGLLHFKDFFGRFLSLIAPLLRLKHLLLVLNRAQEVIRDVHLLDLGVLAASQRLAQNKSIFFGLLVIVYRSPLSDCNFERVAPNFIFHRNLLIVKRSHLLHLFAFVAVGRLILVFLVYSVL